MRVRIEPSGPSTLSDPGVRILLDGEDASRAISGYELKQRAGKLPELEIDLRAPEVVVDGEAEVLLSREVCDVLQRLGWTPPSEGEEG